MYKAQLCVLMSVWSQWQHSSHLSFGHSKILVNFVGEEWSNVFFSVAWRCLRHSSHRMWINGNTPAMNHPFKVRTNFFGQRKLHCLFLIMLQCMKHNSPRRHFQTKQISVGQHDEIYSMLQYLSLLREIPGFLWKWLNFACKYLQTMVNVTAPLNRKTPFNHIWLHKFVISSDFLIFRSAVCINPVPHNQ